MIETLTEKEQAFATAYADMIVLISHIETLVTRIDGAQE